MLRACPTRFAWLNERALAFVFMYVHCRRNLLVGPRPSLDWREDTNAHQVSRSASARRLRRSRMKGFPLRNEVKDIKRMSALARSTALSLPATIEMAERRSRIVELPDNLSEIMRDT